MFCRHGVQAKSDEFVFDIASGKIPASINGMKLILRADVDDEFLAFLDHLTTEVFVLNANDKQGRIVGNSQRAEGELYIAFSLPSRRNKIEPRGRRTVRLRQRDFT